MCSVATSDLDGQAVAAVAGFGLGEVYMNPWTDVPVPMALQKRVFPFADEVLGALHKSGCTNNGSINFLELLIKLRPFVWRVSSLVPLHQ